MIIRQTTDLVAGIIYIYWQVVNIVQLCDLLSYYLLSFVEYYIINFFLWKNTKVMRDYLSKRAYCMCNFIFI